MRKCIYILLVLPLFLLISTACSPLKPNKELIVYPDTIHYKEQLYTIANQWRCRSANNLSAIGEVQLKSGKRGRVYANKESKPNFMVFCEDLYLQKPLLDNWLDMEYTDIFYLNSVSNSEKEKRCYLLTNLNGKKISDIVEEPIEIQEVRDEYHKKGGNVIAFVWKENPSLIFIAKIFFYENQLYLVPPNGTSESDNVTFYPIKKAENSSVS